MGILRVYRNRYQDTNYILKLIETINTDIHHVVCRWSIGVTGITPEEVYNGFSHVQRASGKTAYVKAHCFSLDFEDMEDEYEVRQVIEEILDIITVDFQAIAVLYINAAGNYECIFVINSISYRDYRNFHSNNNTYSDLMRLLRRKTKQEWIPDTENTVYFRNDGNDIERYREFKQ
ncbi:MAG: hypothetical protein E7262_10640 [Lachnospiraceae bacterium]|nr:hypothetical protein [Lachnospiraceae bacterium]